MLKHPPMRQRPRLDLGRDWSQPTIDFKTASPWIGDRRADHARTTFHSPMNRCIWPLPRTCLIADDIEHVRYAHLSQGGN
jgi:hypothetical protein